MTNQGDRTTGLARAACKRIGMLLNAFHMRPEESSLPDQQLTLILELQRRERERRRQAAAAREALARRSAGETADAT